MVQRKTNQCLSKVIDFNPHIDLRYMSVDELKNIHISDFNRKIDRNNLNKLKNVMAQQGTATMPPIMVNTRTGNVIDGQHRLRAFESLVLEGSISDESKLNVIFVDLTEQEERCKIVETNTILKKWAQSDFIDSYVKEKNPHYIKLREICERHPEWLCEVKKNADGANEYSYKYRYAAAMVTGAFSNKYLKDGSFTMTDEDAEKSVKVFDEFVQLVEILGIDKKNGAWIETFFVEWHTWRELLPFDEVKEAVKYIANSTSDKHNKCAKRVQQSGSRMDWRDLFNAVKDRIKKQAK